MFEHMPSIVGASGGVVTALVGAVGIYAAGRESGKAAFITAVHKAAESVMKDTRELYDRNNAALMKCEERDRECRSRVNNLEAEVAKLMSGAVPIYKFGDRDPSNE